MKKIIKIAIIFFALITFTIFASGCDNCEPNDDYDMNTAVINLYK